MLVLRQTHEFKNKTSIPHGNKLLIDITFFLLLDRSWSQHAGQLHRCGLNTGRACGESVSEASHDSSEEQWRLLYVFGGQTAHIRGRPASAAREQSQA